jgi:hypothetical protein
VKGGERGLVMNLILKDGPRIQLLFFLNFAQSLFAKRQVLFAFVAIDEFRTRKQLETPYF